MTQQFAESVFYRNLGHQMFSIAFKAADDARTQIGSKVDFLSPFAY